MVHQNPPQNPCGDREKVNAIVECHLGVDQTQVGFVNQGRRPQRMLAAFRPQAAGRKPPQLPVHERHELIHRPFVPIAPLPQQARDGVRVRCLR